MICVILTIFFYDFARVCICRVKLHFTLRHSSFSFNCAVFTFFLVEMYAVYMHVYWVITFSSQEDYVKQSLNNDSGLIFAWRFQTYGHVVYTELTFTQCNVSPQLPNFPMFCCLLCLPEKCNLRKKTHKRFIWRNLGKQ